MSHPQRKILVILVAMVVLPLVSASAQVGADYEMNEFSGSVDSANPDDDARYSRSSSGRADNYQIVVDEPVSMPEVNGSWVQDKWSGGGGQDIWSEPTKFKVAENLYSTDPEGDLELELGTTFEAWKQLSDGPDVRYRHRMVYAPGNKVFYIYGGLEENYDTVATLFEYNPDTDTWREIGKTGRPQARANPTLIWDSNNDLLWVYGGSRNYLSDYLNDLWCYNPDTDKWTRKADGPGARCMTPGVFNPETGQLIFYGGYDGDYYNPPADVFVYNTDSNTWNMREPFTPRYYHSAVWAPKTKSMFVYGGVEGYISGVGYKEVEVMSEYFPGNDTWVNHTGVGKWRNSIMVWNTHNQKIMMHSGLMASQTNETWFFDVEHGSWEQSLDGPSIRYDSCGDWDSENKQFVMFGGKWYNELKDCWTYSPLIPGYKPAGELFSSVYDAGFKVNPRKVSFNLSKHLPSGTGSNSVRIQLAGSTDSPVGTDNYIGPDGTATSHFSLEAGQSVHSKLKGMRYFAYFLNISTDNQLYTPSVNWIKVDYYTYPSSWTFESPVYELNDKDGFALRHVRWTMDQPSGTGIEVYFRQAYDEMKLQMIEWEQIDYDQKDFDYKNGKYFQYKIVMNTADTSLTPELYQIVFTYNLAPDVPSELKPELDGWVGGSNPEFRWIFTDSDMNDFQTGIELQIASDENFWYKEYSSGIIELTENRYELPVELEDGQHFWRMRFCDNYESWSDWSEVIGFNVDATPPSAPRIDCYTHPLSNLWYGNNQPRFDWNEPVDATGIAGYSYLLDQKEFGEPAFEIMMTSEEFEMKRNVADFKGFLVQNDLLSDGIWYFHLRAVDNMGHWSNAATRTVKVDILPPSLSDQTTTEIGMGQDLTFKVTITETLSGIDGAVLYWRYSEDLEFQTNELYEQDDGAFVYTTRVDPTTDLEIQYYIVVYDRSEPANELRYPKNSHMTIELIDSVPPNISKCTGDISQSAYHDLSLTVEATDNVGIAKAKVFFNGESDGRELSKKLDGSHKIVIERNDVLELSGGVANSEISYYIMVWDYNGNTARVPEEGNYIVTLRDLEDPKDDPEPKEDVDDNKGLFEMMLANIIALVVIVVFVGLMLFFFIRKQSENIYKDRHKLRMAIADVSEGAKTGSTEVLQPVGISSMDDLPGLPRSDAGTSYDPAGGASRPALPPVIDVEAGQASAASAPTPQPQPVPYLPPAQDDQTFLTSAFGNQEQSNHQYTKPVSNESQASLAGPEEVKENDRFVDEPSKTDLRVFGNNNNPGRQPSLNVEVKPGISVSLPKDN